MIAFNSGTETAMKLICDKHIGHPQEYFAAKRHFILQVIALKHLIFGDIGTTELCCRKLVNLCYTLLLLLS